MPRLASSILLVVAVLLIGACGDAGSGKGDGAVFSRSGSLTDLRSRANQLVDGTPASFAAQIRALRGHPIVVNQWASWCGPCRFEFPFLKQAADKYASRVAFLGDNAQDARDDAEAFLRTHPVPYPHYYDQDGAIARSFRGGRTFPTTAFYDASGKLTYVHMGAFSKASDLDAEIRKYATDG